MNANRLLKQSAKWQLVFLVGGALALSACEPQLSGEEGNLQLSYDPGPALAMPGSAPLAVGARLDYVVREDSKDEQKQKQNLRFESATSSDESIIKVAQMDGAQMTLEALKEGTAKVDVEAKGAAGILRDRFALNSAKVDALQFDHLCAPGDRAAYLTGRDIQLRYTMKAGSQTAAGYGYYPVEFSPADGATLGSATITGLLALHTGEQAGTVDVHPKGVGGNAFGLELVTPQEIVGLRLLQESAFKDDGPAVQVQKSLSVHVLPLIAGEVPVCQSDLAPRIQVDTPDTCAVTFETNEGRDDAFQQLNKLFYETHSLKVRGLVVGDCKFSLALPEEAGDAGTPREYRVQVVESADDNT